MCAWIFFLAFFASICPCPGHILPLVQLEWAPAAVNWKGVQLVQKTEGKSLKNSRHILNVTFSPFIYILHCKL